MDLGASINLIPLSMLKKIGDVEVRPTRMTLQLADRSIKYSNGIVEDMILKVYKFLFPVDFNFLMHHVMKKSYHRFLVRCPNILKSK